MSGQALVNVITQLMLMTDVQTKWMLLELELLLIDLAE